MISASDQQFIDSFEACTFPAQDFHHPEHIKVAWLYLQMYPVAQALDHFSSMLRQFATANGKPNLYHETITWSYMLLINERVKRTALKQDWDEFREANADLFDWKNSLLKSYYRDETLTSDLARQIFVMPDR